MRHFNALVFDENVPSTATSSAPLYTSADLNNRLAQYDSMAIQFVADSVAGGSPTLTVAIEHSADGRNWIQKNTGPSSVPEINNVSLTTNSPWGYDPGNIPTLGLARLKIYLAGTTPSCHLKLYVTARDRT